MAPDDNIIHQMPFLYFIYYSAILYNSYNCNMLSTLCNQYIIVYYLQACKIQTARIWIYAILPQHCLYFLPLPHGHGSFGYTLCVFTLSSVLSAAVSSLFVPVTFATCFTLYLLLYSVHDRADEWYPPECLLIISSNISNPAILYSTSGSLCPYACRPIP